jgi:hypothetical protein
VHDLVRLAKPVLGRVLKVHKRQARSSLSFLTPSHHSSGILRLGAGGRAEIPKIVEFWRGELPLGRAFWLWGILGGGVVSLLAPLFALMLVAAGAPAWLAVLVFAAHIPWNFVLLVGVWRSAERPGVSPAAANLARLVILAWVVVLSLL